MTAVIQLGYTSCRCFRLGLYRRQHLKFAFRSKSSIADKNQVGKAIKKLNIENKYLFGDLVDRPRPGPRQTKKAIKQLSQAKAEAQPLDGIQSEIIWYQSMGQKVHKQLDDGRGYDLKSVASQHFSRDNESVNLSDISKANELTPIPKFVNSPKSDSIASSVIFSESKKSVRLPNVIIRNIETFPCFNTQKTSDISSSHDDTILNISRGDKKYLSYPSVTKILNATMSDASIAALAKWKQNLVAELGEEGFLLYQDGLLRKGVQFHQTIHNYLSGVPAAELEIDSEISGSWQSLSPVIAVISGVKVLESHVVHPQLMYRGVIDCVADYKGKLAVIEWKKSDKCKRKLANTYDAPLQLAAYLGAMNYDVNYPFQTVHGAVVVAYTDGSPANVFSLLKNDCIHYWSLWLRRLHMYWQKQVPSDQENG